jgi:hypothetical protein
MDPGMSFIIRSIIFCTVNASVIVDELSTLALHFDETVANVTRPGTKKAFDKNSRR